MSSTWTGGHALASLLDKMQSQDSDFRYMALNDLINQLNSGSFVLLDQSVETSTVDQVLQLIRDSNGEVKNMAVKCIGILVTKVREKQVQIIVETLVDYVSSSDEQLRDIASLCLKTIIAEIPDRSNFASVIVNKLAPRLVLQIAQQPSSQELLTDSLDILTEVITRFASAFSQVVELHKNALKALLQALQNQRPAVVKRSLNALGALGSCSTSEIFTQLSVQISGDLESGSIETTTSAIQLIGILARTSPRRLGRRLSEFMPQVIQTAKQVNDQLRQVCMQTIETILLRCPSEVTPFVVPSIQLGLELIKHDPNYAGDDIDSDQEMFDDQDDEDDDLIEEDYSDDDDMSWKVRRASAKVLNAAIASRPEMLAQNVSSVAPVLVQRFSEREDSVRLEILDTFLALLKQMQIYGTNSQSNQPVAQSPGALKRKRQEMEMEELKESPRKQLLQLVPSLAKALSKETVSKSIPTRHKSFIVLRELVTVLHGGLDDHIGLLVGQIEKSLKGAEATSGPGSNLKAEILGFLGVLFSTHPITAHEHQLPNLVTIISGAVGDKLHRNCIQGFQTCSQLVSVLRPLPSISEAKTGVYKQYVVKIYNATVARLNRIDSDQEIKERGISCLGILLAHAGDDLQDEHGECLQILIDRLRNEVTRYVTVKVVGQVASSPICQGPTFETFVEECIRQVATLLRKSNRLLKLAAFDSLAALLSRPGTQLSVESSNTILAEVEPLLSHDLDMNLLPLILKNICLILKKDRSVRQSVQESILPRVYGIVCLPLAQGPAMDSLLEFFKVYAGSEPAIVERTINDLFSSLDKAKGSTNGTHAYSTISRCIGAVATISSNASSDVIARAHKTLETAGAADSDIYFNLLLLGELGRLNDLSDRPGLFDRILGFYSADSEEVKIAAAFAVGNMAVGALSTFLPLIEEHIGSDRPKRLLSLHALKELISHGSAEQLVTVAERVWIPLFDACETKEEGIRNIGAECLARLTLTEPAQYLAQLHERLGSPSSSTRSIVIAAVRFTLTESSVTYDEILAPILIDFLCLLRDPELEVRRNAMFALNSAAHNKPFLIRDHLGVLLPLLYAETQVREELLRKVSMGPFTVTTDDGLDLRKNAFETMYQLLDTCLSRIHLPEYLDRVIAGLSDDDGIKVLCYLMLIRLAELAPISLSQRLEDLSNPISSTLKSKLKDNTTKQEIEKQSELHRFIIRTLVVLSPLSSSISSPNFVQLFQDAKTSNPLLLKELQLLQQQQQPSIL